MKYVLLLLLALSPSAFATTVCGVHIPSDSVVDVSVLEETNQLDINEDLRVFRQNGPRARACKNGNTWALIVGNNESAATGYRKGPSQNVTQTDAQQTNANHCSIQPMSVDGLCVLMGQKIVRCFSSQFPRIAADYKKQLVEQGICQ